MLVSNFFSLFARDVTQVAKWINIMSALASALTIAFLYWTITHLARKIIGKGNDLAIPELISIIGAGVVGCAISRALARAGFVTTVLEASPYICSG